MSFHFDLLEYLLLKPSYHHGGSHGEDYVVGTKPLAHRPGCVPIKQRVPASQPWE